MGIVYTRESAKDRGCSGKEKDGTTYSRSFIVRTDSPSESLDSIVNSCGVSFGDPHPDNGSSACDSYDCKVADDVGLLYVVTFNYAKAQPGDEDDEDKPGGMDGKIPSWGASSSVTSGPVWKDVNGDMILNSAGDPLEGLEKEQAEFRLTLTQYFQTHTGWLQTARQFTNTTNNGQWNGGDVGHWKCQGCSAKLNVENNAGVTLVYWEVNWEFAYREGGWDLKPWDLGFAQLVNAQGEPEPYGSQRKNIVGQDGKPVRQPVGLNCAGVAVQAGQPPCELFFQVYERKNFGGQFGELYTPGAP